MSEFQYVAFRAIDRPLSAANLEFMRKRSTRAKITRWSFENEYHYSDFRGNADEMLRRGYDVHLHYANFGIRRLMFRFSHGMPNADAVTPYLVENAISLKRDKQGPGAIFCIEPEYEPGELEELWDLGELFDGLIALRSEISAGDLRPLYLAHLAAGFGSYSDRDETLEAPVPAGLNKLTAAQQSLATWYGLTDDLLAAAAECSPPLPDSGSGDESLGDWVRQQPLAKKDAWLVQWLTEDDADPRGEIRSEFQRSRGTALWPTAQGGRTIRQLEAAADEIANRWEAQAAKKAAQQRERRLAKMASDPDSALSETESLVALGGGSSYDQAAELLAELREALTGVGKAELAEQHAYKLHAKHPTRHRLLGALRKRGFVPKKTPERKGRRAGEK